MQITKTTVKTYEVKAGCNSSRWNIPFGKFKDTRIKNGQSVQQFEKCFICGHKFADDEIPNVVVISTKGNRFSCDDCYKKLEQEVSDAERN